MKQLLSLVVVLLTVSGTAMAQGKKDPTAAPGINKRISNQKKRISHKLEKGKITQEEANKLNQNVDAVQAKEAELAKDGKLTKEERKGLHEDLKKNSEAIKETGAMAPKTGN